MKSRAGPDNKDRPSHRGSVGLTSPCRAMVTSEAWRHGSAGIVKCSPTTLRSLTGWAAGDTRESSMSVSVGVVVASSPAS